MKNSQIRLTDKHAAIVVPDEIIHAKFGTDKSFINLYHNKGFHSSLRVTNVISVVGVTPLTYEIWCSRVFSKEYESGDMRHGSDIIYILEELGLTNEKLLIVGVEE